MAASEQTQGGGGGGLCGLFFGKKILRSFGISLPYLSNIMLNLLTKSSFGISLLFKLMYAAILLLSYIVNCELAML